MVEYKLNSDFYNLSSSIELLINQNHHYITNLFVSIDSVTSEFRKFDVVENNKDKSFNVYTTDGGFVSFEMKGLFNKMTIEDKTVILISTKTK